MRNKLLVTITTFILLFLPLFFAPQIKAAGGVPLPLPGIVNGKSLYDYGKEFCDKRSGDLMNLETWYSGKCSPDTDTLSGDGIGFSDIILLQSIETVIGPQYYSFPDLILKMLKGLNELKEKLTGSAIEQPTLALTKESDKINTGIISSLANVTVGLLTTKPATSLDYLAYVSSNLKSHKIIKESYAASPGYGFTALSPILPLWRAFRNITYLLFALVFVVYGVMIMLRVRIDAKTAATVQLAIPKLITTLLLITFSYSIVGFLVDLSTVATYLSINILYVGGILLSSNHIMVGMASGLAAGGLGSWFVNSILASLISPFVVFNLLIGGATGSIVATIVAFVTTVGIAGILPVLISVCISLAIAYAYLKLIFKLFEAFFSILVSLIFAPVIILGNVMPGSSAFSGWIMTIIGNLAVFPTAAFFLVLSYALMCQPLLSLADLVPSLNLNGINLGTTPLMENLLGVKSLATAANIWTPPLTIPGVYMLKAGSGTLTGGVGSLMIATIGFGLLLMASKYVDMVREALKVPPFKYGSAIGEALSVPVKVAQAGYAAVQEVIKTVKP